MLTCAVSQLLFAPLFGSAELLFLVHLKVSAGSQLCITAQTKHRADHHADVAQAGDRCFLWMGGRVPRQMALKQYHFGGSQNTAQSRPDPTKFQSAFSQFPVFCSIYLVCRQLLDSSVAEWRGKKALLHVRLPRAEKCN